MSLIWPSQHIARAIAEGIIRLGAAPDADQVQPASLDLRLGATAYRLPASFLPGPGRPSPSGSSTCRRTKWISPSRPCSSGTASTSFR